ncbi:YoaK family protein [Vogesella fluminis]|uniref:YoaK family protein n=1 Tax=Vogesella fluminis TaxID=1069161 RepID=UPI00363A5529
MHRQHFSRLLDQRVATRSLYREPLTWLLGGAMAFIAGALNAGGFLAVQRYTSHVSGVVSSMADHLVLGDVSATLAALAALLAFIAGAAHAAWLINWARRQRLRSGYGVSLIEESLLLLLFGVSGAALAIAPGFAPPIVLLLCFIMGMHNTIVTKLSGGLLRSTHMTGIATDIGIELARASCVNRDRNSKVAQVHANRERLQIYLLILGAFFVGGLVGALGFSYLGYGFSVPLALFLFGLGLRPLWYDLRLRWRWWRNSRGTMQHDRT